MYTCHTSNAQSVLDPKKCKRFIFWFVVFLFVFIMSSAIAAKTVLLCIGDSITERNPSGGENYVKQLEKMLGSDYEVKNFGISGYTMTKNDNNTYWECSKFKEVFQIKPDIITLMLGTNDAKSGIWSRNSKDFKADAQAMVDTFLTISPKPRLLLALPPQSFGGKYGISGSVIANEQVPILREIAKNTGIQLIDAHTPMNSKDYFADGVHPNKTGCDLLAKIFYESLTMPNSVLYNVQRIHTTQSRRPVVKIGIVNPTGQNSRISGYHIFVTDNAKNEASSNRIFLPSGKQIIINR